jgi:hypothetical protein
MYPNVKVAFYMTSCYSGHWVQTTEFQGSQLSPVILAATEEEQESFGFVWSHSQRHAGGLFSSAAIAELLKEPSSLPPDAEADTSRTYREMTAALVSEMHRLCLPANIKDGYGLSPLFSDIQSQEKFWWRTGYSLYGYKANYDKLRTLPASDPHPKADQKKFEAGCIDGNHCEIVAWNERHPGLLDEDYPEATGGYGSTRRGLLSRSKINYLYAAYLRSHPETHTQDHKDLMHRIRSYRDGHLDRKGKLRLRNELAGKLRMNQLVNQYAKILGLHHLSGTENWSIPQISAYYQPSTFNHFWSLIAKSHLFHFSIDAEKTHIFYYKRPAQYLAASMLLAEYEESDVEHAIKTLLQAREKKLVDRITSDFMRSMLYSQTISTIRTIIRDSAGKSTQALKPLRPSLSDVEWQ